MPDVWEELSGPLVPPEHLAEIETALRLAFDGDERIERERKWLDALIPPLAGFETLLDDAFGTIAGEPDALERFTHALLTLERPDGRPRLEGPEADERLVALHDSLEGMVHEPGPEHVIPEERRAPVLFAAAWADAGQPVGTDRRLAVVFEQFQLATPLNEVWRTARRALGGEPRELKHFAGIWKVLRRGRPVPDGPLPPGPLPPFPDGPLPWPLPRDFDPSRIPASELRELVLCAAGVKALFTKGPQVSETKLPPYAITSISPSPACAGTKVVLTGTNFGSDAEYVSFTGADPVLPDSWSDTSIDVTVPAGATCGTVTLLPSAPGSGYACGRLFKKVSWPGTGVDFGGSAADIKTFTVNGKSADVRVDPGGTMTVTWGVCPTTNSGVTLEVKDGAAVVWSGAVTAVGTKLFAVRSYYSPQDYSVELKASNPCNPAGISEKIPVRVAPIADLTVTGIEVTQAIQYYKADQHLTDPLDRGPTNSLELVAQKETWVRVYVDSGVPFSWGAGRVPDVTAVLRAERLSGQQVTQLGTRTPHDPIAAWTGQTYQFARRWPGRSLDFRIPYSWCEGTVRFEVELNPDHTVDESNYANNVSSETVTFGRFRSLELRTIFFSSAPTGGPSIFDLEQLGWMIERMFPLSYVHYVDAGDVTVSNTSNWNNTFVFIKVDDARLAAGNPPGVVFVGLYPQTAPSSLSSFGGGGVAIVRAGSARTLAHEVGHALGLPHAPCAMPPGAPTDPTYPAYEPYDPSGSPFATIGEYGWDVMTRQIHDPHVDHDVMSYCVNPWISIHNYKKLSAATGISSFAVQPWKDGQPPPVAGAGAGFIQTDAAENGEPSDHLYVLGAISAEHRVELHAVRRVRGHPTPFAPYETPYRVLIEAADGRTLASAAITCGLSAKGELSQLPFAVSLPASDDATRIVVERDGEPIHSVDAPPNAPELEITDFSLNNDVLRVRWRSRHADDRELTYWVRFSADGGETWRALTVDPDDGEYEAPLAHLSGGGACVIEVAAHDGFHSVYRATDPFELPLQPPVARIVEPRPESELESGRDVLLSGSGSSPQDGALPNESLGWSSDRDGELGFGRRLVVDELSQGRHRLRVAATDARGEQSVAEVEIDVPANGHVSVTHGGRRVESG